MFFFQLDIATRVQYALNIEEDDIAQQLRNKLTEGSEEEEEEEDQIGGGKMKSSSRFFTIGLLVVCYSSNIGILLLNKYLLSNYGFKYPIFLTMCHMTACSLLSYIAIVWMKVVPMQTIRSRVQFFKISALSLIFCVSVVFGNISLRYLSGHWCHHPFLHCHFCLPYYLQREAWLIYLTLVPVVTGAVIASGDIEL